LQREGSIFVSQDQKRVSVAFKGVFTKNVAGIVEQLTRGAFKQADCGARAKIRSPQLAASFVGRVTGAGFLFAAPLGTIVKQKP
jgi:hypothetical protein